LQLLEKYHKAIIKKRNMHSRNKLRGLHAVLATLLILFCMGARAFASVCEEDTPNPIVVENRLKGTSPRYWDINGAGDPDIQGFATRFSVSPGETVTFKIKSISDNYRVDIYRLGYYQGHGARKVGSVVPAEEVQLPQSQPDCHIDKNTLLYDCGNWHPSVHFHVPENATSGVYIARLTRQDNIPSAISGARWRTDYSQKGSDPKFRRPGEDVKPNDPSEVHSYGANKRKNGIDNLRNSLHEPRASHIPFVVRTLDSTSKILFQTSDTTWQAYNRYGGTSTYGSYKPSEPKKRCYEASYNRPFENREYRTINYIFGAEFPAIRFLERNGYDVSYWSGLDTHMYGKQYLSNHKVFLSVGHDEYWSRQQRRNVENGRDAGVNLMFWSGNEVFWKIRWENSTVDNPYAEPRTLVCYKETQENEKIDPKPDMWTGTFRDTRPINPEGGDPENSLTGQIFTVNAWRNDALVIPRSYARLRIWKNAERLESLLAEPSFVDQRSATYMIPNYPIYENMFIEPWTTLKQGILGHEWDEDLDNGFRPAGSIRMSRTAVDNVLYIQDSGSCYDTGSATHHLTLYRSVNEDSSSSLVFGAGTVQWTWGLDPVHDNENGLLSQDANHYDTRIGVDLTGPDASVQQATVNLFAMMGKILPETPEPSIVLPSEEMYMDEGETKRWKENILCKVILEDEAQLAGSNYSQLEIKLLYKDTVLSVASWNTVVAGVEISKVDDVQRWHPANRHLSKVAQLFQDDKNDITSYSPAVTDPSYGMLWHYDWPAPPSSLKGNAFLCRVTNDLAYTTDEQGPFTL